MAQPKSYLDNYWSLFLEFIDVFNEVRYNDIPLALLANFYQLLHDDLKAEMRSVSFNKNIKQMIPEEEIQQKFDKWINPLRQSANDKREGKVLLNYRYLRFSQKNYNDYFDKSNTIIFIQKSALASLYGFRLDSMESYHVDVRSNIKLLTKQAELIFDKNKNHRVYGDEDFKERFMKLIPSMIGTIAAVENYMNRRQISSIVVGTTEDLTCRVLTLVGAKRGIPSICLQHGLLTGEEAYLPVFATKMGVYGMYEKNFCIGKGVAEDQLAVIGHPKFDDIHKRNHISKLEFLTKYKLDTTKKTIFIATQPFARELWNEVIENLVQLKECQVVIKPHPIELSKKLIDDYKTFERKFKNLKLITNRKTEIYDILPNVDVVIVNASTVGLESVIFNTPLCAISKEYFDYFNTLEGMVFSDTVKLSEYVSILVRSNNHRVIAKEREAEFLKYVYPNRLSGPELIKELNNL